MKIQFNTDKTINGDEKHEQYFTDIIAEELDRFESHITRIEVHLSDENGNKSGNSNMRCLLEARIEKRQPIVVSSQADTIESALSTAINKLKTSLDTILGRKQDHHQ